MQTPKSRTIVYVDGFNLYYGSLRNTSFKWLDLPLLFKTILDPDHDIQLVRYFTAKVKPAKDDQLAPQRQDVYLRALQHFRPNVKLHLGYFSNRKIWLPLVDSTEDREMVKVKRMRRSVRTLIPLSIF
ncbi:MAG: NYN domain-containing protein [Bacteroidetes bacterium]|nr:NYN domain-containing protein [Bacteroidota bacterium]